MRTGSVVRFEEWTQGRFVASLGTNSGAPRIPFQSWHHFKEAFAPEIVSRAIKESDIEVSSCLDPFGGSGTTALACQFLGVHPTIIEVNPYLADLIEVKLAHYDVDALALDLNVVLRNARLTDLGKILDAITLPATFVEPGVAGRWIFNLDIARQVHCLLCAINKLDNRLHRQLFKIILGGILISVSNVVISGKGRRYRRGWKVRRPEPEKVAHLFSEAAQRAILEVRQYENRAQRRFDLLRGDSRVLLRNRIPTDLAVFSPPYPNSFDYTDVYNVELWVLGYLGNRIDNQELRRSTLCSHVQISRDFPSAPPTSPALTRALEQLNSLRPDLWSSWIPEMVGGYFSDLSEVLSGVHASLSAKGKVWMVVGDSRYGGVQIETAGILAEIAPHIGYSIESFEPFRSMRSSAQQGGRHELSEALLVLSKESS